MPSHHKPSVGSPETAFAKLVAIMHRLRAPGGCPWDAEQTHASLKPYAIEEAYELVDAIDSESDDDLREELGDVMLQVVFHAELASERSAFSIGEVIEGLCEKLVRRHPHVFGDTVVEGAGAVAANWARIKATEKTGRGTPAVSAIGGVPRALPALLRAHRIGQKTAAVGFDWDDPAGVREKLNEEIGELDDACSAGSRDDIACEMGDVLFTTVSLARLLGMNAESVLHQALDRFESRFRELESEIGGQGGSLESASREDLENAWARAKQRS